MREEKMLKLLIPKQKKGGVVSNTVFGVGGLIIGVIIILVVVQTLTDASLLTSGSAEERSVGNMTANFTAGIDKISSKIPTILLNAPKENEIGQ